MMKVQSVMSGSSGFVRQRNIRGASIARRGVLGAAPLMLALAAGFSPARALAPGALAGLFERRVQAARERAAQPFVPPKPVPVPFSDLGYETFWRIRFREDKAIWRGRSPFEIEPFHRGWIHTDDVAIFDAASGEPEPFRFDHRHFYAQADLFLENAGTEPGFAGLRVLYPLNRSDKRDEVAAFLGASYFRGLGQGCRYGASARGISVNTGIDMAEEFPAFRAFTLVPPDGIGQPMALIADLSGPRVEGAYLFRIHPGAATRMEIESSLFLRADVAEPMKRLGLAPLTSMFLRAPQDPGPGMVDYRPHIHDSEVLLVEGRTGDGREERQVRFLRNPPRHSEVLQPLVQLRRFGLMQRNRDFALFQDLEARYDLRPHVWVEPRAGFGSGNLALFELAVPNETFDNINAFWVPTAMPEPGERLDFAYDLFWSLEEPADAPQLARATAVRLTGQGAGGADPEARQGVRFLVDFAGRFSPAREGEVEEDAEVVVSGGRALHVTCQDNPVTGGRRVHFDLMADQVGAEFRCRLMRNNKPVSETAVFQWSQ